MIQPVDTHHIGHHDEMVWAKPYMIGISSEGAWVIDMTAEDASGTMCVIVVAQGNTGGRPAARAAFEQLVKPGLEAVSSW